MKSSRFVKGRRLLRAGARLGAALLVAACQSAAPAGPPAGQTTARANPASVNCGNQGGRHSTAQRGDGGEFGICQFPDGRQCDEWALLRGACPPGGLDVSRLATPAARYCVLTGGLYQATGEFGTEAEQGACTFPNGATCDARQYFDGTCTPESAAAQKTFTDAFAYCAAVGTIDQPDERFAGPPVPDAVIEGLVVQGVVAADTPAEFLRHAAWRCMDGEVFACHFGANLPCLERADDSRSPSAAMTEFCAANPAAEAIPAAVTGRATIHSWGCAGGQPVALKQVAHADARGFQAEIWHRLPRPDPEVYGAWTRHSSVRISHDGRVASIPIDPDNVAATREVLQAARFDERGIHVSLYEPVGLLPQMLVSGEPETVKTFIATAQEMFLGTGRKHLVGISARLTQLSDSDIENLGINVFPNSITYSGSFDKFLTEAWSGSWLVDVNSSGGGNVLVADESLSRGKTLMASQVFTPNGVKAEISDVQHDPAFGTDSYGNIQTNYQDLETNIEVTPVVMDYDQATRALSRVRLDITVKVSLVTGEKRMSTVSAPTYSDKSFKTTRVFPADGRTYLVGSFVSDSEIESRTGVPYLSKIPLLKYLFSQKSTTRSRTYALLTLAVSVFPDTLSSDELWNRQGGTRSPTDAINAGASGRRQQLKEVPKILDQAMEPPEPPAPEKRP